MHTILGEAVSSVRIVFSSYVKYQFLFTSGILIEKKVSARLPPLIYNKRLLSTSADKILVILVIMYLYFNRTHTFDRSFEFPPSPAISLKLSHICNGISYRLANFWQKRI